MIAAAIDITLAAIGITAGSVSLTVNELALFAVPTAIAGGVFSSLSVGITALFLKSKLCKIAFFINVAAFIVSAVSIILWLALL